MAGVGLWVFTVAVGVAFVWAWAIGARLTVVVLFGLVAVACMVLTLVSIGLMISARSSRRLLRSHGWHEATVQVYTSADRRETRLLVADEFPAATEVLPGQVAPARLPRASGDVVAMGTLANFGRIARRQW